MSKYWIDPTTGNRVPEKTLIRTYIEAGTWKILKKEFIKCLTPDEYYQQSMLALTLHEQNNGLI